MTERTLPVVTGTDKKGELVWGIIPMPYWQQAMFKVRYAGDFAVAWMRRKLYEDTGIELDIPSMNFNSMAQKSKKRRTHPGD